jgi:diguanylate cyclase (GGDEF)-like protein
VALTLAAIIAVGIAISTHRTHLLPFLMVLAAAPIIPFVKWFEPAFEQQATDVARKSLNNELDIAEAAISRFFQSNRTALESITVLAGQDFEVTNQQYQDWLTQILPPHRNQYLNVALSNDLIVQHVYPENEANNRVMGVDLADVPGQGLLYRNAQITRQAVVIGPVMLLQGVPGIIFVRPVAGPNNSLISGVLSLEYLKDDLEILISDTVDLTVNISTLANDHWLMENNQRGPEQSALRPLRYEEIEVMLSASSRDVEILTQRTRLITRVSAGAFWLVISLILSWQHMNYRIRDKQRKALKRSETELNTAQRLGQMGSWSSEDEQVLNLSTPLKERLELGSDTIALSDLLERLHPVDALKQKQQLQKFFSSAKSHLTLEHQLKIGSGYRWYEHRIARAPNNQITGILRDIHELRTRDEKVAQLESFDSLTGAANRHYFKQITIQNIALCERRRTSIALVLINIDDFRSINEKFGQVSGDELLKQITHRLQSSSRKSDTVARLSGDTFAVALVDIHKNQQTVLVIDQILRRLKEPYILNEDMYPQFTMGVSMFPSDGLDYDTLLRMAESALNTAKKDARGHYRFYSAELSEQTDRRQRIISSLPAAMANDYLSLVFQPRVESQQTSSTRSMEALVRWNDPVLGNVSPGEFIPIAEESSLIADIGHWVMENVFKTMAELQHKLPDGLTVSINLSPRQLEDPTLPLTVNELLTKYGVHAANFELEITEHSISEQSDAILRNMHELSKMGFLFALDDFGTGYSNLGILQSLPLHVLKVDMSFIRVIGTSEKSDELVRAIINMGHTLGLRVVAEGVESAAQVKFLQELNCEELQGYYFYKPIPISDLIVRFNNSEKV